MPLSHLEHFLIQAEDLEATRDWYVRVLGLRDGPHPDFGFPVHWLYIGETDVLGMIRGVKALGLEACCTLGMVTADQARRMKEAGLDAYNHNLDSSEEFYGRVISTRTYADRLRTLGHVREAGISVCCGGIVGMGETEDDRIGLLHTLATLPEPPESVRVNALVAGEGTPLGDRPRVAIWDMVRTIATARILMPRSMVRSLAA